MGLSKEDKKFILDFCKEQKIKVKTGWQNFTGSVSLPESLVLDIQTEAQAVALAKFILKLNSKNNLDNIITYRAVAAGESAQKNPRYDRQSYSMTPVMEADILLQLRGKQFHEIHLLNEEEHIVRVGPSIQMGDLDSRLYYEFERVLPTSTLIPWVTIGGSATGTHGTGRDQPSIAGLIRRLRILRPDGEIVEIDKDTKVSWHNGKIVKIDKDFADFDTIRAAHLGLFGIVLDMDVQCQEAKKLEVTVQSTNVFNYKKLIKEGLYKDNEYVSVAYFADGEKDEGAETADTDLVIMTWKPVPLSTPDKGNCTMLEHMSQRLTIFLQESLNINALLKKFPKLVPLFKQFIVAPIQVLGQNKTVVVPWPVGAHNQSAFPHDLDDEDDLFPVSEDCHELLDALNYMVATLNKHAKHGLNPSLYAMYFRYFKGTNGGLSTSAHGKHQHVVGFDMTSARNMPGFSAYKKEIREYLMENYHAKPHHGKSVPANANYAEIYGKGYTDFMLALKRWVEDCTLDFSVWPHMNPFFRHHLGIGENLLQRVEDAIHVEKLAAVGVEESAQTLAQHLLDVFDDHADDFKDDKVVKKLRDHLELLVKAEDLTVTDKWSSKFQPREDKAANDDLVEVPYKPKKDCCAIL